MSNAARIRIEHVFRYGHIASECAIVRFGCLFVLIAVGEHLRAKAGVATLVAFSRFLDEENGGSFFCGGFRCDGTGAAETDDDHVVFSVPCDGLIVGERFVGCTGLCSA